jgi:hypothetical protein
MQVRVIGRSNPAAPEVISETFTFDEPPVADAQNQPVNMKATRRLMALEFESNVAGGDFQMGKVFGYVTPQETRNTGP